MISRSTRYQKGISLIAAIFILVALSLLGALMTVLVSSQSQSAVSDLYSTQALFAAESGVQASAYLINQAKDCTAATVTDVQLDAGTQAWYSITSTRDATTFSPNVVCQITATGKAGGSSANPISQRQFKVTYSASYLNY